TNDQYLMGPWAAGLLLPAAALAWPRRAVGEWRSSPVSFVLVVAASYFLASFLTVDPSLGYARDWDLFAPAGVAYTAAGLGLLMLAVSSSAARERLLLFFIATSAVHLATWVWLNHCEPRAMARFATLPLGLGRTELVLGNWYRREGQPQKAEEWLQRAV